MKKILSCLVLGFLLLSSCSEETPVSISNDYCQVEYHAEFKKVAKLFLDEEEYLQRGAFSNNMRNYSVLNVGDEVVVTLPVSSDEHDLNWSIALAEYTNRTFLKDKNAQFRFVTDANETIRRLKANKLPTHVEKSNFSLRVDAKVKPKDLDLLKQFIKKESMPQECELWLKPTQNGYTVYFVFNANSEDSDLHRTFFREAYAFYNRLKKLNLSKKLEIGFMNLDYVPIEI